MRIERVFGAPRTYLITKIPAPFAAKIGSSSRFGSPGNRGANRLIPLQRRIAAKHRSTLRREALPLALLSPFLCGTPDGCNNHGNFDRRSNRECCMRRAFQIRVLEKAMMLLTVGFASLLAVGATGASHADDSHSRFDGDWDTILSCPNSNGALGYSFKFLSTVKNGLLHGEKGRRDEAGWLQLDGKILDDGSADLYVDGLVGAAPFAVGQRPAGSKYGYHVASKFTDLSGTGTRVEGRPCTATFAKNTTAKADQRGQ
jgi:hypothetical protein